VTVKFEDGKYIEIRQGNLSAVGTAADSIMITSNSAAPVPGIYDGIHFINPGFINFDYCIFKYADMPIEYCCNTIVTLLIEHSHFTFNNTCIGNSYSKITLNETEFENNNACILYGAHLITVHNSNFHNNLNCFGDLNTERVTALELDSSIFFQNRNCCHVDIHCRATNCIFYDNQNSFEFEMGNDNDPRVIKNCVFCNNLSGVITHMSSSTSKDTLINCNFSHNLVGSSFEVAYMTNNIFTDNNLGLESNIRPTDSIFNNYIFHNDIGLKYHGGATNTFHNNYICNNNYNIDFITSLNGSIPPTCFCETDSLAIRSKIYDGYIDISRGLLDFTPYINCDSSAITALPPINCPSIPLDIDEHIYASKNELEIFPNPSSESFTVTISFQSENSSLQIFNVTGEVVYKTFFSGKQKEVTTKIPPGIYFVKVTTDKKQFIEKHIIF